MHLFTKKTVTFHGGKFVLFHTEHQCFPVKENNAYAYAFILLLFFQTYSYSIFDCATIIFIISLVPLHALTQ